MEKFKYAIISLLTCMLLAPSLYAKEAKGSKAAPKPAKKKDQQLDSLKKLIREKASRKEVRTFIEGDYLYHTVPFRRLHLSEQEEAFQKTQELAQVVLSDWIKFAYNQDGQAEALKAEGTDIDEIDELIRNTPPRRFSEIYDKYSVPNIPSVREVISNARTSGQGTKEILAQAKKNKKFRLELADLTNQIDLAQKDFPVESFDIKQAIPDAFLIYASFKLDRELLRKLESTGNSKAKLATFLLGGVANVVVSCIPIRIWKLNLNTGRLESYWDRIWGQQLWVHADFLKKTKEWENFLRVGVGGLWGDTSIPDFPVTTFGGVSTSFSSQLSRVGGNVQASVKAGGIYGDGGIKYYYAMLGWQKGEKFNGFGAPTAAVGSTLGGAVGSPSGFKRFGQFIVGTVKKFTSWVRKKSNPRGNAGFIFRFNEVSSILSSDEAAQTGKDVLKAIANIKAEDLHKKIPEGEEGTLPLEIHETEDGEVSLTIDGKEVPMDNVD